MSKKKLLLITTGGTIACVGDEHGHAIPKLTGHDLLNELGDITAYAAVDTVQFKQIPSSDVGIDDVLELARLLNNVEYDGFIITHGTDSIEETAFALDLIYDGEKPVIITGAMRHATLTSPDGSGNLLASIIVASHDNARQQGVMVVMNDTVHAARYVRKAHSSRLDAFVSEQGGILGYLSENNYIVSHRVSPLPTLKVPESGGALAQVPILKPHSGDDGQVMKLVVDSGCFSGVVLDGLGGGHVSTAIAAQIERAQLVIVIASRTGGGSTYYNTYGSLGSEVDLISKKAIMAGQMNALQARIYLQFLLVLGFDREVIKQKFNSFRFA